MTKDILYNLNLRNKNFAELRQITTEYVTKLLLICFKDRIESIYLVGSQVDKSYSEMSDIDLLVILKKGNVEIKNFSYLLSFLTPIVVDIKLIDKENITKGKAIIDPCINYKRQVLFGKEDESLFTYTIEQYNILNLEKILQILTELKNHSDKERVILNKQKFNNMSNKKLLSLSSRVARYLLGVKLGIVTYTKEQTLEKLKKSDMSHLVSFLEDIHKISNKPQKQAGRKADDFIEYYSTLNKETRFSLPEIAFK